MLLKIKHWSCQKDDVVFNTSTYLPFKAIVSEDRHPYWLTGKIKGLIQKGTMYINNSLKIISEKTSLERLKFSKTNSFLN